MTSTSAEETFLAAVRDMTAGRLDVLALVSTSNALTLAARPDLAAKLYLLGIDSGVARDAALPVVNFNLAVAQDATGDTAAAISTLRGILANVADFHPAWVNLGALLAKHGDVEAALGQWRAGVGLLASITPAALRYKKIALRNIAHHCEEKGRYAEAEAALAESLELDPHQTDVAQKWLGVRQERCSWPLMVPPAGLTREQLSRAMLPLSVAAYADDPLLQLASAWEHWRASTPVAPALRRPGGSGAQSPEKLRIGYLSSDLCSHAVGYLVPEAFERHDRHRFEIHAYYTGARKLDPMTERLRGTVDAWADLEGLDDHAAAQRIADDGIHILVDLNGHTRGSRPGIIARRPAPILVNWLGYPGTMGSPQHHYIVADDWIIPQSHEMYYSEKVVRLPCYQPNETKRTAEAPPSRAQVGLPEGAMIFCCFNSAHKITRFMFDRWMDILRQVPESVLWLFDSSADGTRQLRDAAAAAGIAADRLIFAPRQSNRQHLARYRLADLFLDTAPYGAHTTGSDALWMGLPILTLSGRCFASRVCGSLARSAGLPELVCTSPDQYVALAVELGQDRQRLAEMRARLMDQRERCALFDMSRHVAALEVLYGGMWDDYVADRLPVPQLANLDAYLEAGVQENYDIEDSFLLDDLHERYRRRLTELHAVRPLVDDNRLWGGVGHGR